MEDLSKKYKKHELRDHIYNLPDTYIGSIDKTQLETFLYDEESKKMVKKVITYVPGLFKIFDETIVNASDHIMRLKEEIKNKKDDVRLVKNIKVITSWRSSRLG
jgi:DNA topoisomerase-2